MSHSTSYADSVATQLETAGATEDHASIKVQLQREVAPAEPAPPEPAISFADRQRARQLYDQGWSTLSIYYELPWLSHHLTDMVENWSEEKVPEETRIAERRARREAGEARLAKLQKRHDELDFKIANTAAEEQAA